MPTILMLRNCKKIVCFSCILSLHHVSWVGRGQLPPMPWRCHHADSPPKQLLPIQTYSSASFISITCRNESMSKRQNMSLDIFSGPCTPHFLSLRKQICGSIPDLLASGMYRNIFKISCLTTGILTSS
jgi:hypothetical protein